MTKAGLKAILQKHGAAGVIVLGFDNDYATYYVGDDYPDDSMFSTVGDVDCVLGHSFIMNKKTGKYDIPVTTYKPLDDIQTVVVLDNNADRDLIHIGDLQMR